MNARLLLAVVALLLAAAPALAQTKPVAIVGATAWPLTDGADKIENATIVLRDGRIESVQANGPVPADAERIDARAKVVTPSLISAATQLGLVEVLGAQETVDRAVRNSPLGAAFDVQYALNPNSVLLRHVRADGVTRALSFPDGSGNPPFAGQAALLKLGDGPDLLDRAKVAMFVQAGGSFAKEVGGSRSAQWILLRNALDEAKRFRDIGKSGATRDQLLNHLEAEALQPVLDGKMPLAIVAQRESDIRQAVQLGQDYALRVVVIGGAEAWRAASLLAARNVPVILDPTFNLPLHFDEIGARIDSAALLHKAGVRIAFYVPGNTLMLSYNAGTAIRDAAGMAVANGLAYVEALCAITRNPAAIWGQAERYGTLAPGREADLVVWDGDPLEPTTNAVRVFVQGKDVSLATRQDALRDRYRTLPDAR
ncbi:amidohydrolase family protein [Roseiterribacter gracilis]|uniref:Amidohydrolase n=1 Tax=Roseiterribacter gracilis TaxID=2812848 RepID=A0A8S8XCY5_9PROT|nr:amidohydrolase [Rhodospirillales bacterium TMPK1]